MRTSFFEHEIQQGRPPLYVFYYKKQSCTEKPPKGGETTVEKKNPGQGQQKTKLRKLYNLGRTAMTIET